MPRPLLLGLCLLTACSEAPISIGGVDAATPDGASDAHPRHDADDDGGFEDADVWDAEPQDVPAFDAADASPRDGNEGCRVPSIPAPARCGDPLCGNGVRDYCQVCGPRVAADGGGGCVTEVEDCDQGDLGGNSCERRGWSWGQLSCNNTCGFDEGSCASCDRTLGTACAEALVDARDSVSFDVAAKATGVAVTWVTRGPTVPSGAAVHVALLTPELAAVAPIACFRESGQRAAITDAPRGWLLALGDASGVRIVPLDDDGLPRGSERNIPGAVEPRFISASSGARALTYSTANGRLVVELLDRDGASQASASPFSGTLVDVRSTSGSGNEQRWFVAARHQDGTEVAVLDARLQLLSRFPLGNQTEYPMVAAGPTGALLSFADFSNTGTMYAQFLDQDGGAASGRHLLGTVPELFNPAPTLFDGVVGRVLLAGYTGGTGVARDLSMAQLTMRGGVLGVTTPIARAPLIQDWRAVAVADGVLVGWRVAEAPGLGRIALARVPR